MCYLLFKPAGQTIEIDWLVNAYENGNSDGCGLAYFYKGAAITLKTLDLDEFLNFAKRIPKAVDAILHLRMASTGVVCEDNCHPFEVGDYVAAHNGCIFGYGSNAMTDTEDFLRKEVVDFASLGKNAADLSAKLGWGKMVFLSAGRAPFILNEDKGEWAHGCWHSNQYYQPGVGNSGYLGHETGPSDALGDLLLALENAEAERPPRELRRMMQSLREKLEEHLYARL